MRFDTQHPQGMVKIGDDFYLSSVEIKTPTKRFPQPVDGYDRDTGEGAGHLFKFDKTGKLLADLPLGEGHDLSPGRHRLRRALHLGAGRRVPAEQRVDRLPRRSGHDEGDRGVPLRRSRRRHRAQHRRQDAARRELGLAPLLPLHARRPGPRHQRVGAARRVAQDEQVGLHRLPGLQVPRPPRDAVLGPQQLPDEEGRPALPARRLRDRRPAHRPGDRADADRAVGRVRAFR